MIRWFKKKLGKKIVQFDDGQYGVKIGTTDRYVDIDEPRNTKKPNEIGFESLCKTYSVKKVLNAYYWPEAIPQGVKYYEVNAEELREKFLEGKTND